MKIDLHKIMSFGKQTEQLEEHYVSHRDKIDAYSVILMVVTIIGIMFFAIAFPSCRGGL